MRRLQTVIGGDFPIDIQKYIQIEDCPESSFLFSCGRAALYAILTTIGAGNRQSVVLVPDYLCDSVTNTITDVGMLYRFYHIGENLLPKWDTLSPMLHDADAVILINYFGLLELQPYIDKLRNHRWYDRPAIILDCVQDFYGMETTRGYDFAFSSFRKWFPVPDGAEVQNATGRSVDRFISSNEFAQYKFAGNILKNFSAEVDSTVYLSLLEQGEAALNKDYRCECSVMSRKLIPRLELKAAAERRMGNAQILHEGLQELKVPHLYRKETVPMAIPVFLPAGQRDEVRRCFFNADIFTPVHWPWKSQRVSGENVLYHTELSLICDQRYGENEMRRELSVLHSALRSIGK